MGAKVSLLLVGLLTLNSVAKADITSLTALLMPAIFGVTERRIDNDYAKILSLDPRVTVAVDGESSLCTGTFLSSTTLVTAVHCIDKTDPTGNVNVDGIESLKVYFSEKYKDKTTPEYDIAFVIFPKGTGEFLGIKSYPKFAPKPLKEGATAYLVGFGMNVPLLAIGQPSHHNEAHDQSGAGIRGWGTTKVIDTHAGVVLTDFVNIPAPGKPVSTEQTEEKPHSLALPGDSGGAVYNEEGEIVAIVSEVGAHEKAKLIPLFFGLKLKDVESYMVMNVFVDVTSDLTDTLISSAQKCANPKLCAVFDPSAVALVKSEGKNSLEDYISNLLDGTRDPFAHVTLRTGRYTQKENPAKVVYLRPNYSKLVVTTVDLAELDGTGSPKIHRFYCHKSLCADPKLGEILVMMKKAFFRYEVEEGEKGPKGPMKVKSKTLYQFEE